MGDNGSFLTKKTEVKIPVYGSLAPSQKSLEGLNKIMMMMKMTKVTGAKK